MSKLTERRRDNQQWMLDWIIKTTGRVQNFAYDNRVVPKEVKSYAQIHRIADKHGRHIISIAEGAESKGITKQLQSYIGQQVSTIERLNIQYLRMIIQKKFTSMGCCLNALIK